MGVSLVPTTIQAAMAIPTCSTSLRAITISDTVLTAKTLFAAHVYAIHLIIPAVKSDGARNIAHAFHVLYLQDYAAGWARESTAPNATSLLSEQRRKMEDVLMDEERGEELRIIIGQLGKAIHTDTAGGENGEHSSGIEPRLDGATRGYPEFQKPFASGSSSELDVPGDWGDMPLYADFYSIAIPVVVHHNPHKDGAKNRRYLWWDRIWFFPYLRDLIEVQLRAVKMQSLVEIAVNGEKWCTGSHEVM
ncbi:hypothetical protein F53441_13564 [Fusarium austroafricanum]|uniref:Uncharacterized protein n=1 Tax=Fusarium austroafricanum TaxID=2364996 RepID=A0A8H4NF03_9HYPO|nr:hypothetical protein F53441_13564 [Fusarium austroafricanum]